MEDLQVKVEKKVLTIATSDAYNKRLAEKDSSSDTPAENEKPAKPLSSYREFRKDATFSRSFQLPKYVDISSIKAQLSKGILSIRIQKAEDAQPQLIEIA
jgi:HSP20 family protein